MSESAPLSSAPTSDAPSTPAPATNNPSSVPHPAASLVVTAILSFFSILPLPLRRVLGSWGGLLFSLIPTRERQIADLQLKKFLSHHPSPPHLREVYRNIGITALETLNLKPIIAAIDEYVHCPRLDLVQEICSRKIPVLALTAHTSNWDLLGAFIISKGIPVTTVGKEARISLFQELVRKIRASYGITTIWRSDRLAIRALMEAFRRREVVAALVDQDTEVQSMMVPFMGLPARTPSTLVELAKRSGAIIVSAFLFRESSGTYTAYIEEIDPSLPVDKILLEYNNRLGHHLNRYPSQWVWFHKRWRSRSLFDRMRTAEYIKFLSNLP